MTRMTKADFKLLKGQIVAFAIVAYNEDARICRGVSKIPIGVSLCIKNITAVHSDVTNCDRAEVDVQ